MVNFIALRGCNGNRPQYRLDSKADDENREGEGE